MNSLVSLSVVQEVFLKPRKRLGRQLPCKNLRKVIYYERDPAGGPEPPSIAPIGVWLAALWAAGWAIEDAHHA